VFYTPIVRDFCMWCGGREVSRKAIDTILESGRSALLVPGGQREMRHSSGDRKIFKLVSRHKGFVRIAIAHGVDLVPIFSFGEDQIVENIRMPRMQAWTTKFIGYGVPFVPFGRWYTPLPNRVAITVVVGPPIPVGEATLEPTNERVDRIFAIYYYVVRQLFEKYKKQAGYDNAELIFEDA